MVSTFADIFSSSLSFDFFGPVTTAGLKPAVAAMAKGLLAVGIISRVTRFTGTQRLAAADAVDRLSIIATSSGQLVLHCKSHPQSGSRSLHRSAQRRR